MARPDQQRSEDAPVSSATTPVAEEPVAAPEEDLAHAPVDEGEEPGASVPAGDGPAGDGPAGEGPAREPEAPVGPASAAAQQDQAEAAEQEKQLEHEQQLERDLDELTAKAQKADEYLELAQRTRADFENYRKRAAREAAVAQERGVVKLVRELLPAVDNLDRALQAIAADGSSSGDELVAGIKLVHAEVIAALGRAGVERFSPEGERFDPERHEAVAQQPVEGAEAGTIVEVYQRGYRLGDSVIRPARVLVAG
jgi:molecular chaperone GrpE